MEPQGPQKLITDVDAPLLADIHNVLVDVVERLDKLIAKATGGGGAPKAPKEKEGGLSAAAGVISKFVAGITAAIGAVLAFVALPPLMTAAVLPFVRALNPGLVEQFERTLSDLQATVGYGLEPIIAQATATVRELASELLPTLRELRPELAEISKTLGGSLAAAVHLVVELFKVALAVNKPYLAVISTVTRVVSTLVDVLASFLGAIEDSVGEWLVSLGVLDDVNSILTAFKDVLNRVVTGMALFLAGLLKLVGATDALAKFRAGIEKRIAERSGASSGLAAAPRDVSTGSIESISAKLSERAFAAMGGEAAKTDTDLLKDILGAVKAAEEFDLGKIIKDAVRDGFKAAKDEVVSSVPGAGAAKAVDSYVADTSASTARFGEAFLDTLTSGRISALRRGDG